MTQAWRDSSKHWEDWVNMLLGVWITFSPWLLAHPVTQWVTLNAFVVGLAIFCISVLALTQFEVWEEWLNLLLGAWLVVSPWVLGFSGVADARWNCVISGAVVAVLAVFELWEERRSPTATHA